MIDVSHQINTVERRVGTRTLAAGEARTVTISRVYDTPLADLWDACTNPERISRWFLPISGDLRPGGQYAFEGNASGTIERCEPPPRLRRHLGERRADVMGRAAAHARGRRPRRGSRSSTSRTSRTSSGPSSARARSASAGTTGCSA